MRKLQDLLAQFPKIEPLQSRYLSRWPCILTAVGSTGSGKSYAVISLIKLLKREGVLSHLFLISPTASSNTIYKAILGENDVVYDDLGPKIYQSLREIQDTMNGIADNYAKQLQYAIAFEKFVSGAPITTMDEMMLEEGGFRKIVPKRPSFCLFIDDAQSSAIFSKNSKNPFPNLVLRSRHCAQGLGCSIMMAAQSIKNGVPKSLRLNNTHLLAFKTHNKSEIDNLYEEVAGFVSREEFERTFHFATAQKHGYLYCDMIEGRLSDSF